MSFSLRYLFASTEPDPFAETMVAAFRRAGLEAAIERDPSDPLVLRLKREPSSSVETINLHNVHAQFCSAGRMERGAIVDRFVRALLDAPKEPLSLDDPEVRANLLPAIRHGFNFQAVALNLRAQAHGDDEPPAYSIPTRPFGKSPELVRCLVVDAPDSMQIVSQSHLDESSASFEELERESIERMASKVGPGLEQVREGLYMGPWQDDHDLGRVLVDQTLRGLDLKGDPVALMPSRNHLIVTGADDPEGLLAALEVAKGIAEEAPSLVSSIPMVRRWPEWEPLTLSPQHPAFAALSEVRCMERGSVYAQQKQLLEAAHEVEGDDLFVATYQVFHSEQTGAYTSIAAWTRDVDSLLPVTDLLSLVDLDAPEPERVLTIPWGVAESKLAHLLEPTDLSPPRWRVRSSPSESDLDAVRPHHVEF